MMMVIKKFANLLLPIIKEKQISISSAVVCGYANGDFEEYTSKVMNWDEISECSMYGAEISAHSYTHLGKSDAVGMTYEEILNDYEQSRDALLAHGLNADGFVYCGDSRRIQNCVDACKAVFSYGISNGENKSNYERTTDRYKIKRYTIDNLLTEELKVLIDGLVAEETGWMVWMVHTSYAEFQQEQADVIGKVIDYALSQGIEIVTTKTGVKYYAG